jgi:hypothetical protein
VVFDALGRGLGLETGDERLFFSGFSDGGAGD